jgi:hypothetical protein
MHATNAQHVLCPAVCVSAGLISAAPGKKNSALQVAARQVEAMVTQKMAQQEYIILCLEDSSDWNNATTRRTVMQVGSCTHVVRPAHIIICHECVGLSPPSSLRPCVAETVLLLWFPTSLFHSHRYRVLKV